MALSELYQNSATISTTEYDLPSNSTSLGAVTTDGAVQVLLDCNALAAGDVFQVRLYEKISSGGTQRGCQTFYIAGVQADPIWVSPTLIFLHGWTATVKKIAGTDRAIPWSIRSAA